MLGFRFEGQPPGFVAFGAAIVPGMMVKDELALPVARKGKIHSLDIRQDRRVLGARILKVHHPLDDREIVILDADAVHLQSGAGISPNRGPFGAVLVESP